MRGGGQWDEGKQGQEEIEWQRARGDPRSILMQLLCKPSPHQHLGYLHDQDFCEGPHKFSLGAAGSLYWGPRLRLGGLCTLLTNQVYVRFYFIIILFCYCTFFFDFTFSYFVWAFRCKLNVGDLGLKRRNFIF